MNNKTLLKTIITTLLFLALATSTWAATPVAPKLPRLKISENKRFLVREDGAPFFWLGDTAWELFHRLSREEAARYLENRADKGFTVIQAVVLAELDGQHDPNAYGQTPLINDDPARPNEEYFKHVDWIVNKAEELGLYIGMLPTWGDKWHAKKSGDPVTFNPQNAGPYGEWLARRYKDKPIVWILGGDRPIDTAEQKATLRAMALGLRQGDGGAHLITLHPRGGAPLGSATWLQDADWIDFHMMQNGHGTDFKQYANTAKVYALDPAKPVLDGEPVYEDHPLSFNAKDNGHSIAADTRRPLYWDLFGGACGHTYGHHSVWQMYDPKIRKPINNPLLPWYEALDQPGAGQMQYGRRLIESRPFLSRIPDMSVIVQAEPPTSVPGAGLKRFAATRDAERTYAMVYAPVGRPFTVRPGTIKGAQVVAWWYNPRNGESKKIGEFENKGAKQFTPPDPGEQLDWVLVLDDAAKGYPKPGAALYKP